MNNIFYLCRHSVDLSEIVKLGKDCRMFFKKKCCIDEKKCKIFKYRKEKIVDKTE
jgi:hypothetical protein